MESPPRTTSPLRIAFVADDLYPGYGGQAVSTEGHAGALLERGHEVRALAGAERSPTEPPGVTVERLPAWRPSNKQIHYAFPVRRKVLALANWADVIHINTPTPLALLMLRTAHRANVPALLGFHAQEESMTMHTGRLILPFLRGWYRFIYRMPDALIAPTPFAARLASHYTRRPVHVVSNGIRLPETGPADRERAAALRGRLLGGKRFLISHVGRLSQEKRPQSLLELMAPLAAHRTDTRLIVAGDGPLRKMLERRRARLGLTDTVSFLGYIPEDEKQDLLRASDLFLIPSPVELQSIATLEEMAHGCPVVAAGHDSSAVPEIVREADAGRVYDPDHLPKAAAEIENLLDLPDELRRFGENAARAAKGHDIREAGRHLEEIYRNLIQARYEARREPESRKIPRDC